MKGRPPKSETEKFVTIPLRVTRLMERRIDQLVAADTLPAQEHMRRAIDIYLAAHEKKYGIAPITAANLAE